MKATLKPVYVGLGWFAGCSPEIRKKKMDAYLTRENGLCGCGKPAQYIVPNSKAGACNKYARCPDGTSKKAEAIKSVEIKAGPELDMAVAEAIGMNATIYYNHEFSKNICLLLPSEKEFEPSTDLNDAFDAAKKAASNQFGDWELSTYVGGESGWTCQIGDSAERAFADTAALAICAAILKLNALDFCGGHD